MVTGTIQRGAFSAGSSGGSSPAGLSNIQQQPSRNTKRYSTAWWTQSDFIRTAHICSLLQAKLCWGPHRRLGIPKTNSARRPLSFSLSSSIRHVPSTWLQTPAGPCPVRALKEEKAPFSPTGCTRRHDRSNSGLPKCATKA